MKLLAFTDPHGDLEAVKAVARLAALEKPDVIVCPGDLTFFGSRHAQFFEVLSGIGKPIYFIPGNHEDQTKAKEIADSFPFMVDVSFRTIEDSGMLISGVPGNDLVFWPGPSRQEAESVEMVAQLVGAPTKPFVFLAHYPPARCVEVDGTANPTPDSGGSETVRTITERLCPALVVTGHYHHCFGREGAVAKSRVINPGPKGRIIEL